MAGASLPPSELRNGPALFFALALLKSKPEHVSVKQHLQQIRIHVKPGQPPETEGTRTYIDAVGYWKERYSSLALSTSTLKRKVAELEEEAQDLRSQLQAPKRRRPAANTPAKRRREGQVQESSSSLSSKRQGLMVATLTARVTEEGCFNVLDELPPSLRNINNHFRYLFQLEEALEKRKPRQKCDTRILLDLCSSSCGLISLLHNTTRRVLANTSAKARPLHNGSRNVFGPTRIVEPTQEEAASQEETNNELVLHMITNTFTRLIDGLKTVPQKKGQNSVAEQVIHNYTTIFEGLLDLIASVSETSISSGRNDLLETMSYGVATQQPSSEAQPIKTRLGRLFITMTSQLDTKLSIHKSILEGILYLLLDRVGALLRTILFDEDEASPRNQLGNKRPQPDFDTEAPVLIWILERLMALLECSFVDMRGRRPVTRHMATEKSGPYLTSKMKARLQNTLLQAIFQDDNANFQDRFLPPAVPSVELGSQPEAAASVDVKVWFRQEVFRIVGREVLSRL